MDVTMFLALAANFSATGQINSLGLGGEIFGPPPLPSFVLILEVKVPLDHGDGPFDVDVVCVDSSGVTVVLGDESPRPLEVRSQLKPMPRAERPPGLPAGAILVTEFAQGMVLDPGLYQWVVSVNGETKPHWRRPFYVRAKPDEFPPTFFGGPERIANPLS